MYQTSPIDKMAHYDIYTFHNYAAFLAIDHEELDTHIMAPQ